MNPLLETIFRLDAGGRYAETIRFLHEQRDAPTIPHEIYQLLLQSRFLEAYVLAQLFRGRGAANPILAFAQALGGFLFGNVIDEAQGAATLSAMVDALGDAQKQVLGRGVVHPVVSQVITSDASIVRDHQRALRILEIYKAGLPLLRPIFDWTAEAPPLIPEELTRQGRARAQLIRFTGPPAGAPRKPWRAIVAMRKHVFPGKADSRLFEMGLRFESAMKVYGWRASYLGLTFNHRTDYAAITDVCLRVKADILFLDDYPVLAPGTHDDRSTMLAELRRKRPTMKVVAVHLDPWQIDPSILVKTGAEVDAIWAHFPANPVWRDPALADKFIPVPFPHAGNLGQPTTPLSTQLTFSGAVFAYNWHRALWLAGVLHGLPLGLQMSTHTEDGIPILDSYAAYFRRIEESACAVNFSMRPDLSRIITGRAFETLLAGALLVQEEAPDMDSYFIPGEHYLSFATVPELRAIARFIAENPEAAEDIRRTGNAFARAQYNDEKLIGYLDKQLFYRH